jgi:hypothetical protein
VSRIPLFRLIAVFAVWLPASGAGGPCVTPATHGVTLSWVASTSPNIVGCKTREAALISRRWRLE